jgi:Zn ribbon nucleic-acid-binding protein
MKFSKMTNYDELPRRGKEMSTGEPLRECNVCRALCYMFYEENKTYRLECENCGAEKKFTAKSLDDAMKQWNVLEQIFIER